MTVPTASVLTPEQRTCYERDGYVVIPDAFGADELARLRAESDRLVELLVNASLALGEASPRLDLRTDGRGPVLLKVQPLSDVSQLFRDVANDPRLLDPMRDLLGCEPLLLEEKLNGKERLSVDVGPLGVRDWAPEFPFHTDLHYFVLDGYPETTLSSAIALDDCTPDNGPLRFVPGSHLRHDWPLAGGWPPVLADGLFGEDEQVPLVCSAGTVVVFHSRIAHASSPNMTDQPRRLLIYSHFPSTHEVEPDARNRDLRVAGQAHERRYADALRAGYQPVPVRVTG
jgi:ectoine hydroxylase-related dioxygenase (phytanoyl-CoA dioxygenase family)